MKVVLRGSYSASAITFLHPELPGNLVVALMCLERGCSRDTKDLAPVGDATLDPTSSERIRSWVSPQTPAVSRHFNC